MSKAFFCNVIYCITLLQYSTFSLYLSLYFPVPAVEIKYRKVERFTQHFPQVIICLGSSIYYWGVYDFHGTALDGEKVRETVEAFFWIEWGVSKIQICRLCCLSPEKKNLRLLLPSALHEGALYSRLTAACSSFSGFLFSKLVCFKIKP